MGTEISDVRPRVLILENNLLGRQIIERFHPAYVSEVEIEEMLAGHARGEKTELCMSSVADFKENIFLVGTLEEHYFVALAHWNPNEGWRKIRWSVDGRQYYMGTRLFIR